MLSHVFVLRNSSHLSQMRIQLLCICSLSSFTSYFFHPGSEWIQLMLMAWASSTIHTYSSAQRQFLNLSKQFGQVNLDKSILPTFEITILCFIAYAGRCLAASSVRNYLSAVRSLHLVLGFLDPLEGLPHVPLVIKGPKCFQVDKKRVKTLITALVLMSIKYQLNFNNYDHIMFWAACCLAFFLDFFIAQNSQCLAQASFQTLI